MDAEKTGRSILKKLSRNRSGGLKAVQPAEPQESAGQLQQAEVVLPMPVVAHQQRPALEQPAQRPLHHPAAGPVALPPVPRPPPPPQAPDLGPVATRAPP